MWQTHLWLFQGSDCASKVTFLDRYYGNHPALSSLALILSKETSWVHFCNKHINLIKIGITSKAFPYLMSGSACLHQNFLSKNSRPSPAGNLVLHQASIVLCELARGCLVLTKNCCRGSHWDTWDILGSPELQVLVHHCNILLHDFVSLGFVNMGKEMDPKLGSPKKWLQSYSVKNAGLL